jgi:hypothetical protein
LWFCCAKVIHKATTYKLPLSTALGIMNREEHFMEKSIEIYIRQSAGRNLLNIYVPFELRELFVRGVKSGTVEEIGIPINFEMSVAPENTCTKHESLHVSVEISAINISYTE